MTVGLTIKGATGPVVEEEEEEQEDGEGVGSEWWPYSCAWLASVRLSHAIRPWGAFVLAAARQPHATLSPDQQAQARDLTG